jgi:iron(III) transport system substrate-binding protein
MRKWLVGVVGCVFAGVAASSGLGSAATAQEVSAELVAKAKQEGRVTYYTDLIVNQIVRPLTAAFEAKYGIRVEFTRADSQDTILKLLNEQRAGRVTADVFSLTTGFHALVNAGTIRKFAASEAAALPAEFKDANGYWVSANYYVLTPAVNTALVPEADRPRTYEDLLAPRWKDKIVWKPNDASGAPGFIGNVLITMGEDKGTEYLRKLSKQGIKSVAISARAVLDQVIAGEFPVALQIFNHHAALSAKKGAPVTWLKMEPVTLTNTQVGLTANSPHPNAGQLLIEFMISKEGQTLFQKADYFPTRSDVSAPIPEIAPSTGHFKANVITPEIVARDYDRWEKIFKDLFW